MKRKVFGFCLVALMLVACHFPGIDTKPKNIFYPTLPPPARPLPPHVMQKLRQPLLRLSAQAAPITGSSSITLAWDASTDPTVTGYKIYQGSVSLVYTSSVDVGSVTTYTFTNVSSGTYFFAATAYAAGGLESDYSGEVSTLIPQPNVISVALQVLVASNPTDPSPWKVYTNMPVFSITNPVSPLFFRSQMTISQSNTNEQVLRLDTSTLVITNK